MSAQDLINLPAASSLAASDIIYVVVDPGGTPAEKKATFTVVASLLETILSLSNFTTGTLPVSQGGTGSTSFAAGSIVFSNGSVLTEDNAKFSWDDSANTLNIRGFAEVIGSSASTPSSAWDYVNHVMSIFGEEATGGGTILAVKHAGTNPLTSYEFTGYRSRGTLASPADCVAGDRLGRYAAVARADGDWYIGGYMDFICDQGFGGGNHAATYWRVATCKAGESDPRERIRIGSDGEVGINLNPNVALRRLEVRDTVAQLRLDYTFGSVYGDLFVNSSGDLVQSLTGSTVAFSKSHSTFISYQLFNQSNASGTAHARQWLITGGASGGDPYTRYNVSGVEDWSVGIDNSQGDAFKISNNASLGANDFVIVTTAGRVGLSTFPPTGGGTPVLALAQATGNPTGIAANTAGLVALDSGGTCELFAWDEAGNVTQLSPHSSLDDAESVGIVLEPEDLAPAVSVSFNVYTGIKVYRYTGPSGKTQIKQIREKPIADWDENQERLVRESQEAIARWDAEKAQHDANLRTWSEHMEAYRRDLSSFEKGDLKEKPVEPTPPDSPGPKPVVYKRRPKPRWR